MIRFAPLAPGLLLPLPLLFFAGWSSPSTGRTEVPRMIALDFEVFGVVQGVFFRKVSKTGAYPVADATIESPETRASKRRRRRRRRRRSGESFVIDAQDLETLARDIYRYTQKRSEELGLKGWCMNTPNGTVLGHLEGEKSHIEEMKRWLRHTGSPQSRIDKAEFRNEKEIPQSSFPNFQIRK